MLIYLANLAFQSKSWIKVFVPTLLTSFGAFIHFHLTVLSFVFTVV